MSFKPTRLFLVGFFIGGIIDKVKKRITTVLAICIVLVIAAAAAEAQVLNLKSTTTKYYSYHDIKGYSVIKRSMMYYHTLNERPVFCVEAGYVIKDVNGKYFAVNKNNDMVLNLNVKNSDEDYILQSKAAFLGYYSIENPSLKDYAFTQMFIWQSLPEHAANGKDGKGNFRSYFSDSEINEEYEVWKKGIEKKISDWDKQPAFDEKQMEFTAGEKAQAEDLNGVLEHYDDFEYIKNGITIKHLRGENKISVEVDGECASGNIEITKEELIKKGIVKYKSAANVNNIFASSRSQDMAAFGKVEPDAFSVTMKVVPSGEIRIIKKGEICTGYNENQGFIYEDSTLEGGTFKVVAAEDVLYRGEIIYKQGDMVEKLVTNREGVAVTRNILPGKYLIEEIQAPVGYISSEKPVLVDFKGENTEVELYNEHQKINFSILKIIEKIPGNQVTDEDVLKEVKYGMFVDDAESIVHNTLVGELYPDENGIITYTGFLPEGQYYIKELSAHSEYMIDENEYYFQVKYDDSGQNEVQVIINGGNSLFNSYIRHEIPVIPETGDSLDFLYSLMGLIGAMSILLCFNISNFTKNKK